eukprot:3817565-Prymnesium_polylepis.1
MSLARSSSACIITTAIGRTRSARGEQCRTGATPRQRRRPCAFRCAWHGRSERGTTAATLHLTTTWLRCACHRISRPTCCGCEVSVLPWCSMRARTSPTTMNGR